MGYFRNHLPSPTPNCKEMEIKEFRVACGEFIGVGDMSRKERERPGWALVPNGVPWAVGMFAVRSRGDSMEPKIQDRMWCLFHPDVVGTRQHRLVLVEDQVESGLERYTLKKYESKKIFCLGWNLGARRNLVASTESPLLLHPPGKRWPLLHLRLVCRCGSTNPACRTVSIPER